MRMKLVTTCWFLGTQCAVNGSCWYYYFSGYSSLVCDHGSMAPRLSGWAEQPSRSKITALNGDLFLRGRDKQDKGSPLQLPPLRVPHGEGKLVLSQGGDDVLSKQYTSEPKVVTELCKVTICNIVLLTAGARFSSVWWYLVCVTF